MEHPPVPTAPWGRLRGRSSRSPSRAGCARHAPEPNPPRIFGRCCPSVQHSPRRAGRVGVSVAGQEMGQGIACTNSPWKGISTCSRAHGEGPCLTESGANWGQRAEQGRARSTLGAGGRVWPLATTSQCSSMPAPQHQPQLSPCRKVPVQRPSGDLQQPNATHGSWEQERFKIYIIYTFIIHPLNPLYANHDLVSAVTFP